MTATSRFKLRSVRREVTAMFILLLLSRGIFACSCRQGPACSYIAADIIFIGRVSFNNDDGSGTIGQSTLVRFDLEERLKGIAPDVQQIWIDPGSFTSCYEQYDLGKRYLIFAKQTYMPGGDSPLIKVMRDGNGKVKPIPAGIDPDEPPIIYDAPECMGSRTIDGFPGIGRDLALLRAYLRDPTLPRVRGHVFLFPYRGWPLFTGPSLPNAEIELSNVTTVFHAISDASGDFSIPDAPEGFYEVRVNLPPFVGTWQRVLQVPAAGCGYANIELRSPSTLRGVVLDRFGHPAPEIPVVARIRDNDQGDDDHYPLTTTTDSRGRFTIRDLPDADVYLFAGKNTPSTKMPYLPSYYPHGRAVQDTGLLRLAIGENRSGIVLRLGAPLAKSIARVRVIQHSPGPPAETQILALDDEDHSDEFAKSNRKGLAAMPCLLGRKYVLKALSKSPRLPSPSQAEFTCGTRATLQLTLDPVTP